MLSYSIGFFIYRPFPVMVFVHGGGFVQGSGGLGFFGAERFMDYDVVSSHYILHAIGQGQLE
jgi:carboxylesterase type B